MNRLMWIFYRRAEFVDYPTTLNDKDVESQFYTPDSNNDVPLRYGGQVDVDESEL